MPDTMTSLMAQETQLRSEAVAALQKLVDVQDQIEKLAINNDREARRDPIYRRINTAHSSFIIRFRRGSQVAKACVGGLRDIRIPGYTSPESQIEAYKQEHAARQARKERLAARRAMTEAGNAR